MDASQVGSRLPDSPVRVVCVGSSAGGLEALTELLGSLPVDLPVVYVVAQHLPRALDSPLADLLGRGCPLPVRFAVDGEPLAAGVVLVAPPGRDMTVVGPAVRVVDPVEPGVTGPHPNIDALFRSAADGWGARAVAVVLSGTGRDGAAGVVAVRTAGGLTLAQSPETARFADMPLAAAGSGAVDLVLAPAEVGPAVGRLASMQAEEGEPTSVTFGGVTEQTRLDAAGPAPGVVEQILAAVRAQTGTDFAGYKAATIDRQVRRRMVLCQVNDIHRYAEVVADDPAEAESLRSALLVPVTSFFRDPAAWTALEGPLRALVDAQEPGQPIRVWVPGCATGQEAYTVGMVVAGLLGGPANLSQRLKVFATDLSDAALDVARRGQYADEQLASLPSASLERWTRACRAGREIVPGLRDCVVFARHNVALDPPFPKLHLVSLRNTLIYFEPLLQERVLRLVHFGLVPAGLLLLGESERVIDAGGRFESVDAKARLYRRSPGGTSAVPSTPLSAPERARMLAAPRPEHDDRTLLRDALIRRFAPPSLVLDGEDEVIEVVGEVSRWCWVADGQHSSHVVALLREELRPVVRSLLLRLRHGDTDTVRRSVTADGRQVLVSVSRLGDDAEAGRLLVSFDETGQGGAGPVPLPARTGDAVDGLAQELASTEAALQASIEELSASNEALQALNEELQAAAEELQATSEEVQASNEELEATNEELSSLNSELEARGHDLATAVSDLENIQASVASGLVIVDRELRVTRYTPLAVRVFALIDSDLGRPLTAIPSTIDIPDLERRLRSTVEHDREELIQLRSDRSDILLQFQPYRGTDGVVVGAIVVSTDVTELAEANRAQQRSLRDLTAVTEALPEMVWKRDVSGQLIFLNSRVEQILGLARERVLADPSLLATVVHPGDRERVMLAAAAVPAGGYELEYRIVTPQGELRWVHETAVAVKADEYGPGYLVGTTRDVTDRHLATDKAGGRLADLESMYDTQIFGVVIVDAADVVLEANTSFADLTGYDRKALVGMPLTLLVPDIDDQGAADGPGSELPPPLLASGIAHRRLVARDGTPFFVSMEIAALRDADPARRIMVVHDITRLQQANDQLAAQARYDRHTGLLARAHFRVVLGEQLARAARGNTGLALMWIDLDGFKEINDKYGHRAGDAALREVAARLQRTARQQDSVGRLGGDEFAVLVTDVDAQDSLESVTARVLAVLREPIHLNDTQVYVSGSMGVALAPEDGDDADTLMHNADTAMYSAKQAGRDQRIYFRHEMNQAAQARAEIRHRLAAAVRGRDFEMHYQPILSAATGQLHAVEALVRWQQDGAVVPASQFLGLAEQTGQLPAIARIALELVAEDLKTASPDLGADASGADLPVSINISTSQLEDRHLVDWLLGWQPPGGLGRIIVEVTEATAINPDGRAVDTLRLLRRLGARLSIDDFGTGYSNLALLDHLRPDLIKIDRSLLAEAEASPRGLAVLTAAVQLAHALDAEVVLEGVENVNLLQVSGTLTADYLQGFHLAPPMPITALLDWLRPRHRLT